MINLNIMFGRGKKCEQRKEWRGFQIENRNIGF